MPCRSSLLCKTSENIFAHIFFASKQYQNFVAMHAVDWPALLISLQKKQKWLFQRSGHLVACTAVEWPMRSEPAKLLTSPLSMLRMYQRLFWQSTLCFPKKENVTLLCDPLPPDETLFQVKCFKKSAKPNILVISHNNTKHTNLTWHCTYSCPKWMLLWKGKEGMYLTYSLFGVDLMLIWYFATTLFIHTI